MNCVKCNEPINEGELFCRNCGDKAPLEAQRKRINDAHEATISSAWERCNSPLFLLCTCLFTVAAVFLAVCAAFLGVIGVAMSALALVFMTVAVIGYWRCYAARNADVLVKRLKCASVYDAFLRTLHTAAAVLCFLLFGALLAACFFGMELLSSYITLADKDKIATILGIAIALCGAVCICVLLFLRSFYAGRRKFFLALCISAESGEYKLRKAPVVGSALLGTVAFLATPLCYIVTVVFNRLVPSLSNFGEIGQTLAGVLTGMNTGILMFGVFSFLIGLYYIASAIWISSVHQAQTQANSALATEISIYNLLEKETDEAVKSYEQMQQMMQMMRKVVSENMSAAEAVRAEENENSGGKDCEEDAARATEVISEEAEAPTPDQEEKSGVSDEENADSCEISEDASQGELTEMSVEK